MNGRVYDPLTAQFFSPDPYVQAPGSWLNYNRYGYCYGNPFKYTDPSGEWFGVDDIVALVGGGFINLISNWHSGMTFNEGLSYFIIGAIAGEATLYAPIYAPLIATGAGSLNSVVSQGFQQGHGNFDINNIQWEKVLFSGVMSGATSYVGGELGKALHADKWFNGIESPLLRHTLQSTATNTVVGGTFGGTFALANGQDVGAGVWGGVKNGLMTGTISGLGSAVIYSNNNHVNLLTGKAKPVYHYTNSSFVPDIEREGLRASKNDGYTYTTTDPSMSSDQAIKALSLDPTKGVRDAVFQIDATKMANDGIMPVIGPRPVINGTGVEILYQGDIPVKYIFRIK
jgi:hypothetical protein